MGEQHDKQYALNAVAARRALRQAAAVGGSSGKAAPEVAARAGGRAHREVELQLAPGCLRKLAARLGGASRCLGILKRCNQLGSESRWHITGMVHDL